MDTAKSQNSVPKKKILDIIGDEKRTNARAFDFMTHPTYSYYTMYDVYACYCQCFQSISQLL